VHGLKKCKLKIAATVAVMQFHQRCVVLALLWKLSYAGVFSSSWGVFSVCGFGHSALQSFKCLCGTWTHVQCIHKAHFPSSPRLAQLFCLHCPLLWLFFRKTHLLSSPNPILGLV